MDLEDTLTRLSREPNSPTDLAELALSLARDEYPTLDVDAYLGELDVMAREAARYVRGALEHKVEGLNRYLFHEAGFRGNTGEYYDARNSYLNDVIDRRLGIPLTLTIVTIAVGRAAGLHVSGVALPGHVIAAAKAPSGTIFFDPFHGGNIVGPADCGELVRKSLGVSVEITADQMVEASPATLATRLLLNLKGIYLRGSDWKRAARVIERLRQVAPEDVTQHRDLGICLFRAGRTGRAIDHLQAYLDGSDKPDDADAIKKLMRLARSEVAKWN
jgi:regulator of sirC expression with transglutaminase-like and TPR domain